MTLNWACYIVPGLVAAFLGLFSAIQLLHQRSGSARKAIGSFSGLIYLAIRSGLALIAYVLAHLFLLPADEIHPEPVAFSLTDVDMLLPLINISMRHYIFGFIGGLGSEFLLRGMIHAYTISAKDGTKKEVMIGFHKLIQAFEDYTCTQAAIRDAHRKNKLIDRCVPDVPFEEFANGVLHRIGTYDAEIVQSKAKSFKKELSTLVKKYTKSEDKDDRLYNRLLATEILNTFDKRTLKDFTNYIKEHHVSEGMERTGTHD